MPCHFIWRIFCFFQLAQLLESLEYCDEAVWFPCEIVPENNMGWKRWGRTLGIIEEAASDTNSLMVGINGITSDTQMEGIFLKRMNFILIYPNYIIQHIQLVHWWSNKKKNVFNIISSVCGKMFSLYKHDLFIYCILNY